MEFVLPVVFASGEAMIALLILIALFVIGTGKMSPSEKTLVIERTGQYRIVLAPGLNLVQPFIETVARELSARGDLTVEEWGERSLQFEVRDKHIATKQQPAYLLELSWCRDVLHIETKNLTHDAQAPAASRDTQSRVRHMAFDEIENKLHAAALSLGISLRRI